MDPILAVDPVVSDFAIWLQDTDILTGAFWLSSAYAALLGAKHRKASAMYFTPPYLSDRILDDAGEHLFSGKIIDPACGGAAFLAPAASRISARLSENGRTSAEILEYIEANLFGVDTNPFLCELSVTFLRMVLAKHIQAAKREPTFNVVCGDGLGAVQGAQGTFQLVLCNPPYRKMSKSEVVPYLPAYGHIMHGQPNLYALFFCQAMALLRPVGLAVLLTPMSYLSGRSFAPLRSALVSQGRIRRMDRIHDKLGTFLAAEQDSVVTVWENIKTTDVPAEVFTLSAGGPVAISEKLLIPKFGAPWPVPRALADAEYLPLFRAGGHTLQSYGYTIRTGLIVYHRDTRMQYNRPKPGRVPLIWSRDIQPGGLLDISNPPKSGKRYIDILNPAPASLVCRPAIVMQRVTSDEQKRRLVCAPVPVSIQAEFGGVVGENHVCFIECDSGTPAIGHDLLCSVLRTATLDRLFRCISGATNVSAYELSQLPLPDPYQLTQAIRDGFDVEDATRIGFGLECSHGRS
jgi:hypothetical protein